MKRTLALGAGITGVTIMLGAPAATAAPDPNVGCVGQVTSGLAQMGKDSADFGFRGFAGIAELSGLERGALNAVVRDLCTMQPPPPPPPPS